MVNSSEIEGLTIPFEIKVERNSWNEFVASTQINGEFLETQPFPSSIESENSLITKVVESIALKKRNIVSFTEAVEQAKEYLACLGVKVLT